MLTIARFLRQHVVNIVNKIGGWDQKIVSIEGRFIIEGIVLSAQANAAQGSLYFVLVELIPCALTRDPQAHLQKCRGHLRFTQGDVATVETILSIRLIQIPREGLYTGVEDAFFS